MGIFIMISSSGFGLLLLLFFNSGAADQRTKDDVTDKHYPHSPLLPINPPIKKYSTPLVVAALDGRVYLVDANSQKVLWSFTSGTPIYSSYQALSEQKIDDNDQASKLSDFYIDIGDDWELYAHGPGNEVVKLPVDIEELIRSTPIISAGGGVLLGSKNTTVFLVDAKSGRVVHALGSGDYSSLGLDNAEKNPIVPKGVAEEWGPPGAMNFEKVEQFLYITRKDYALKYVSEKSGKELWYLKFADIEASFRCQGPAKSLDKTDEGFLQFAPEVEGDNKLPLDCQGGTVVYRIRDQSSLERLFSSDGLVNAHIGTRMPSLPATENALVLQTPKKLPKVHIIEELKPMLALPVGERENLRMLSLPSGDANEAYSIIPPEVLVGSHMWYLFVFIFALASVSILLFHLWTLVVGKKDNSNQQMEVVKEEALVPKKKKSRKSGKGKDSTAVQSEPHLIFSNPVLGGVDGRRVGNMFISNKEIGKGSNGTIVLEGTYDGRPVAIKRLVKTHHDVASKEVENLIASDCHPNIVRLYGMEYDQDFVYLSLELCTCSLYDLISSYSDSSQDQIQNIFSKCSSMASKEKIELWKANGFPSAQLLNIMRDMVSGVAHLHELGIIHRDLKPQNVLIVKQGFVRAKLSDMGISKRLPVDVSSLTQTGGGSSGWQAPEQLKNERQTRSMDLFTLGCLLFFCLTGGQHPFGDSYERNMNIIGDKKDLFLIEHIPEALDLVSQLLDPDPSLRPKAADVLNHPLFWDADMRLSFLRDASDRVELEDRETDSKLLKALESTSSTALGCNKWDEKIDSVLVSDIGRYRRYKFDTVRDLLRVIRNKLNHYRELSKEIQVILGQPPEGFHNYFSRRFPRLLIEVYKVIYVYCREEEFLSKYFRIKEN